jgi:hypothetical protein
LLLIFIPKGLILDQAITVIKSKTSANITTFLA